MTTLLVLGILGLVLLAVSLVLGDLFDGVFDALAGDVFSSAVIGAFVSALGFGSLLALSLDAPMVVALPIGAVAGVGFAWLAAWFTRLVRGGGSDDTITTEDTVGHNGTVLSHIPADGLGTVRIIVGGHTLQLNARANMPVEAGTAVTVLAVLSPTAVRVAPVWAPGQLAPE